MTAKVGDIIVTKKTGDIFQRVQERESKEVCF